MNNERSSDPLHGMTLKTILTELVDKYGWEVLGEQIKIQCFIKKPSITSSLKFLRKTPWARTKVEQLYVHAQSPWGSKLQSQKEPSDKHSTKLTD